jgi:hypothetical protein
MLRPINPQTINDIKTAFVSAWTLLPQILIDWPYQGFEARPELCLTEKSNSISSDPSFQTPAFAKPAAFSGITGCAGRGRHRQRLPSDWMWPLRYSKLSKRDSE